MELILSIITALCLMLCFVFLIKKIEIKITVEQAQPTQNANDIQALIQAQQAELDKIYKENASKDTQRQLDSMLQEINSIMTGDTQHE